MSRVSALADGLASCLSREQTMPASLRHCGVADLKFRILRGTELNGPVIAHLADAPHYESPLHERGRRHRRKQA